MSEEKGPRQFKNPFEGFRLEVDPDAVDESVRNLTKKVRELVDQGRYTKVRISYKGKPLLRDIPMGVFLATEAVTFWWAGILSALVVNLGARTIIDVEFIHDAEGRVKEGQEAWMSGDVEAAEEKYREALEMKPDHSAALYHLGILLRVTGRRKEALACLEQAAADEDFDLREKAQEAVDKIKRGPRTI